MKKMRIAGRRIVEIILLTAALALSGCGDLGKTAVPENLPGNQSADETDMDSPGTWAADGNGWTSENGSFQLPINESEWYVEKDEENNLFFSMKEDGRVVLFLSEWENMELPSSFDFETYLEEYAKEITAGHFAAKILRIETTDDARGRKIGIVETQYAEGDSFYHVSLALVPESDNVLVFTMMNPDEVSEKSTGLFDEIVKNIQFLN